MPRILRILNRLNIGGPTYNVAYLSRYLDPHFQTRVLAGTREPHEGNSDYILNDLGVPFEYVPNMNRSINPRKDMQAYRYIYNTIRNEKPDIVHTHAAKAGVLGRLAAHRSPGRPRAIVHTYHGNVFDGYFSPVKTKVFLAIERYLCGISTAIVAISEHQKNDLVNKYKIAPASKVHVIKLGFDLHRFTDGQQEKRAAFRQFYGLRDDEVAIVITGRLTAIKNHSLFIESVALVKQEDPGLKIKVFIVGDGELLDSIIALARDRGLSVCAPHEDNYHADIIFTSWWKDIDVINAGADIVALTSLNEGTPVSIIEAQASETAVICTDVGGVKDVVTDGYNGLLCEGDAAAFAGKLKRLIVNAELRNRIALNGKKSALENYSYARLVAETENLYNYLLS
ncbi:MAG TPA: glycosyltransferase [Mucilaginibacter sp.]|nr:glycosyltransferase [Mucilaginibacter sp.]